MTEGEKTAADLAEATRIAVRDLERIVGRLRSAERKLVSDADSLSVFGAATLVSGYYSHLERLFERIVRDLNSAPAAGPDWHRRLLEAIAVERPGIRPAVLDLQLAERLEELHAFRHLVRNLMELHGHEADPTGPGPSQRPAPETRFSDRQPHRTGDIRPTPRTAPARDEALARKPVKLQT